VQEQIRDLAQNFTATVSGMLGVRLQYDRASVEWLSGYIERVRLTLNEASIAGLTQSIGSFLGECIIANYGGEWRESEGAWGIFLSTRDDRNAAFPFNKVRKQLLNGLEDSILSFYDVLPIVLGKADEI
jgi:hypothetical protein